MRRTPSPAPLALGFAFAFALAGCGQPDQPFLDATPDTQAMQMELTGDSVSEGLATTSDGDWGASAQALTGSVPEYLQHTRDAIRALNQAVAAVLAPIDEAVAATRAQTPAFDVRVWGPHDHGNATFLFTMKRLALGTFGWKADVKPLGAADSAYVTVMGGVFQQGDLPHHGRGVMGVDLDKLASVDSDFHGNGQMLVGFAHVAGFKVLAYGLHNFSPDVTAFEPIDAIFSGWRGPDGAARVRLAAWTNLADSPTPAKELVVLRSHWLPGVGGRADGVATSGDVPAGHAYVANSCWDRNLSGVDGFYVLRDCSENNLDINCTVLKTAGQLSNCAPGLDEDLPSADPMDPTLEPGAPAQPTIPSAMPNGMSGN
ncbi:MAG TPA: hypothetical protein VII38_03020 [Polyangia bacterium]